MKIGNNLKKLRKEKGATQTEVATFLGVRQNTYSQYENDSRQPDIETLVKLSAFYNTSLDVVVGVNLDMSEFKSETDKFLNHVVEEFKKDERFKDYTDKDLFKKAEIAMKDVLTQKLLEED